MGFLYANYWAGKLYKGKDILAYYYSLDGCTKKREMGNLLQEGKCLYGSHLWKKKLVLLDNRKVREQISCEFEIVIIWI